MNAELKRLSQISTELYNLASSVKVLRNLAWPLSVRTDFLKHKAKNLPRVTYDRFREKDVLSSVDTIRRKLSKTDPVDNWLLRICDNIDNSALLLAARGTKDFLKYSTALYGKPSDSLLFEPHTTLDLAQHFEKLFKSIDRIQLGSPPDACILAGTLMEEMQKVTGAMFGPLAPQVVMDSGISSNVIAGKNRIAIRPSACFSDKDIDQLIEHEIFVHVATSINGSAHNHLPILEVSHPGTTKTQEGLAVFAEFITGTADLDRIRRLSDRVIAIQMAIDGADFIEVYQYYLERTGQPEQAFQNTQRVFRGGVVGGGAPFTKDIVYLEGLINVQNFFTMAISEGKPEYLNLLFAGKMDLFDLPVIKYFHDQGYLGEIRFLPSWIKDKRFLVSHLSYLAFLHRIDLVRSGEFYNSIFR
jgi:uncharacterized protein (TIGR02421 family)